MYSKKIEDCVFELQEKYLLFKAEMDKIGINFMITCTSRNIIEQMALFVKGRLPLREVNIFNVMANLPILVKDSDNVKVTWTLDSKHVTNTFDDNLNNNMSRAFDIAILKGNKPIWDIKVSVNKNDIPDYLEAAEIGKSIGLECGAFWSNPDYPHYQLIK